MKEGLSKKADPDAMCPKCNQYIKDLKKNQGGSLHVQVRFHPDEYS